MKETILKIIKESIETKETLIKDQPANIEKAVSAIVESLKQGGKLLVFGNGGSAADSQHIAAEFVGRFKLERKPLPAVALTTNTSTMSAVANDYGYEVTFSREVEALGKKGDVALGISTSGNSKNVILAIKKAKSLGLVTIALTGGDGGAVKKESDITITVASNNTARVQESHIMIGHIICELVDKELFKT